MSKPTNDDRRKFRVPLPASFQRALKAHPLISVDAAVMAGAPCVRGTRIPVYTILNVVCTRGSIFEARSQWPNSLTVEQVREALSFAAAVIECPLEDE